MPLHLTKVAYGAASLDELRGWFANRGEQARLTTRYLPKRHAELVGGSLYWIHKHHLVARSPILGQVVITEGAGCEHLQLNKPIYARTSAYGHFGRTPDAELGTFTWEKTDLVDELKRAFGR